MGSPLHASRLVLAGGVLLVAAITFSGLPQPYPTWPTVGSIPVNPELVVPGLLGLVAVLGALRDGIAVGSIAIGTLGVVTLWVAATSLYELYAGTGGVFWGGFFTLISGVALAVGVVVRDLLRRSGHPGAVRRLGA
ncbi:hypothetical protein BRD07_01075 [Halobacteriales archaeon QS_9_68_42]|nr:MAG: hypothetical protein BRD07_01075 [Halobacteriales archaeon QS_9_68_42]